MRLPEIVPRRVLSLHMIRGYIWLGRYSVGEGLIQQQRFLSGQIEVVVEGLKRERVKCCYCLWYRYDLHQKQCPDSTQRC